MKTFRRCAESNEFFILSQSSCKLQDCQEQQQFPFSFSRSLFKYNAVPLGVNQGAFFPQDEGSMGLK